MFKKKDENKRKPIGFSVSDNERNLLKKLSKQHDLPMSEILRRGILLFAAEHAETT